MKTNSIISGVAACLLALSLTACDKAKDSMKDAKDAVGSAADATKDAAGKAVDATKDAAGKAMDSMKDAANGMATNAMTTAMGPGSEIMAAAKKAMDDKNYQGVLDELKKLSDVQLSPEQQKMVDGMKEEAARMLATAAMPK